MALEPITRQEQIVAGKKLEPITRMERFLKDYGVSNYFGETTVMGDTLTWDGNTEGLVTVEIPDAGGVLMVKLSDAMPTVADMPNGVTEVLSNGTQTTRTQEMIQSAVEQMGVVVGEGFWVFPEDNYSFMGMMTIPKAGLYVSRMEGAPYHTSLTIPGYNGFETTTIKPIETKYLPEHLHFGTETVTVNEPLNITWDGNTEGLVSVAGMLYKVSDAVLTDEQIKSATIGMSIGSNIVVNDQWDSMVADGSIEEHAVIVNVESMPVILFVRTAGAELYGMTFNEVGIYFVITSGFYTASLTTTEPIEHTKTVVKTIDEKYLPTLTSPSGKKFKLSVDDSGVLSATEV